MQKDRFNAILADLDKITDNDIKSLNQLRKRHPYFQNQYVMIAKALKERNHPKADAFVKKAAIYVSDRGLLKGIVMGTHSFEAQADSAEETARKVAEAEAKRKSEEEAIAKKAAEAEAKKKAEQEVAAKKAEEEEAAKKAAEAKRKAEEEAAAKRKAEEEAAAKKAAEEEAKKKAEEAAAAQKVAEAEAKRKVEEEAAAKKVAEAEAKNKAEQEAAKKVETEPKPEVVEAQPSPLVDDNQQMLSDLERDLKEIKEKKRLLAKLLEQNEEKTKSQAPAAPRKKPGRGKKSQSELIEKFIQNEPQMGKTKLGSEEGNDSQVDLASENIKDSDKFYTETLAKLMVEQKKYKKAIKIYEQLGLKFPEKRAYFASQIEKVKKKTNV